MTLFGLVIPRMLITPGQSIIFFDSLIFFDNGSGRGSRLAGFDAPFNMGSARCKIEWNDNFEATYLKN